MRLLILRTVLVATDLEPSSRNALDAAHRLAALAGASLHVAHITPASTAAPVAAVRRRPEDEVRAALDSANVPHDHGHIHVIPGEPAEAIGALADRLDASVIVLGQHRGREGDTSSGSLSSTARRILLRAHVPCLVAGPPLHLPMRRVLVPTDFSDPARGALLVGLSWASGLRAGSDGTTSLTALHVQPVRPDVSDDDASAALVRELEHLRESAGSWAGVELLRRAKHGEDAALAIERYAIADGSDLVVMGTRGLRASGEAGLGSVSEAVAIRSRVPTLLVPPSVWQSYAVRG